MVSQSAAARLAAQPTRRLLMRNVIKVEDFIFVALIFSLPIRKQSIFTGSRSLPARASPTPYFYRVNT